MLPLFRKVTFERGYSTLLKDLGIDGFEIADLGIGSTRTWHGETKIQVSSVCQFVYTNEHLDPDDDESEDVHPPTYTYNPTVNIKGKNNEYQEGH